ncbi:hypothetical protein QQZ08_005893 [Neonectria magnoliae]|uniref:Ankyrin n=1 Tax=Neonectria magnoliae TaxID=2732573 RepID=A0ABR1I262_9HYPO
MSLKIPTNTAVTNQSEGQRLDNDAASTAPGDDQRAKGGSEDSKTNEDGVKEEPNSTTQETELYALIRDAANDDDAYEKLNRKPFPWKDQLDTASTETKETALYLAVERGFSQATSFLIEEGANVNIQNREGRLPLHNACAIGDASLVDLLLNHGAEVEHASPNGWYPLHYASRVGLSGVIPQLLGSKGPNIDEKVPLLDWTAINLATYFGRDKVVAALLHNGARLDIKDSDGWTPFMTAVEQGEYDILNKLLDHPAAKDAIDMPDQAGRTPIMNLFVNLPEDTEPLQKAKESVNKLLELGAAVDVTDDEGRTVLHHAMRYAVDVKDPELALPVLDQMVDESLLLPDEGGEIAIDAAFTDDPVRDVLEPRLNSEMSLIWFAQSSKRHKFAKNILSKYPQREKMSQLGYLKHDQWTVLQWAIYHRLPSVVWSAASAGVTEENIKGGKKLLGKLKESASIFKGPASKKDSQAAKDDQKEPSDETKVLGDMEDMLDYMLRSQKDQSRQGSPQSQTSL